MGLNTTVLILNDALTQIENDPEFGKKLVKVIRERAILERIVDGRGRISSYVQAGNHRSAASVIETHHADETALVAIGANYGNVLDQAPCREHHTKPAQWKLLEDAYQASTTLQKGQCKKCSCDLKENGKCSDVACPYSSRTQDKSYT